MLFSFHSFRLLLFQVLFGVLMKKILLLFSTIVLSTIFVFSLFAQNATESTREAAKFMNRGDVKGAIAVLDKAIEKKKDLLEAYRMRANLHLFNRDIPSAIADLDKVIEIKPEAQIYSQRAHFKTYLRDSEGALRDFDSAISNGYKVDKAYIGRAEVKRTLSDFDGAMGDLKIAIGLNPTSAQAHVSLASVLAQTGKEVEAIEVLQVFLDVYEGKRNGNLPTSKLEPTGLTVTIEDEKSKDEKSQSFISGQIGQMMKTTGNSNSPEESEKQLSQHERILNISLAYANLAQLLEKNGQFELALLNVEKSINPIFIQLDCVEKFY
jgi:tetratricopeptide (TPR) repeat protein